MRGQEPDAPVTTISTHSYRIWIEEVPWFIQHLRDRYPALRPFADAMAATVFRGPMVEWATIGDDPLTAAFDAALADLDAGRVSRVDRGRILPRWSDGTYHP